MASTSTHLLEQISRELGVSQRTVYRVLNGELKDKRPSIVKRSLRIRGRAKELGYRPNAGAKAIATGKFGSVALLMSRSNEVSQLPWRFLQSINDALAVDDMHLIHASLPDQQLAVDGFVPRVLREFSCDGFLINYTHRIPASMLEEIERCKPPSVWMNVKREIDSVYPDDIDAGHRLTDTLIERGHRKITYADNSHPQDQSEPHHSSMDREAGYRSAMAAAGLTPEVIRPGNYLQPEERIPYYRQFIASPDRPTAIIGYGETTTTPIAVAAATVGITVPEDLSLAGFGEKSTGSLGVMLATMILPYEQMGREAVSAVSAKIDQPDSDQPSVAVPFYFDPGGSIATLRP